MMALGGSHLVGEEFRSSAIENYILTEIETAISLYCTRYIRAIYKKTPQVYRIKKN